MATFNVTYAPLNQPLVDKNGMITPQWSNYMRSLTNLTSNNFNSKGLNSPTLNTSEFSGDENGSMYYDNDNDDPRIIVAGVLKSIDTSTIP